MSTEIEQVMREAEDERMFGQVILDYQDGEVTLIRKHKTYRPAAAQNPTKTTKGTSHVQSTTRR